MHELSKSLIFVVLVICP